MDKREVKKHAIDCSRFSERVKQNFSGSATTRQALCGCKIRRTTYRWWNLVWWSIPYQRSYGRQMRFIVWDTAHDIPFGLILLQSPVLKMSVRDKYLEIPKEELDLWVNKSMHAQRVGALPPYNEILGGKMVALALTSNEIRGLFLKR